MMEIWIKLGVASLDEPSSINIYPKVSRQRIRYLILSKIIIIPCQKKTAFPIRIISE